MYPALTSVVPLPGGGMTFSGNGGAGQAYVLWGTTNLAPANWPSLSTNLADINGRFQFTDLQATNSRQRFYRLATP